MTAGSHPLIPILVEMLVADGWRVNVKRVYRIWRREGLKVPMNQPKRGRLWLNDGSCVRLRPERPNHVWSYDFVQDRTEDGRAFRMLVVLDEFTRRCLAIIVARRLRSDDVLHCLADLFVTHGPPEHIRSDNGPEFVAINVRDWLGRIGVKTLYIEPGSPWENGYCESLNSKLRDELLNGEIFTTLREAQVLSRTGDATTMPLGRIPRCDIGRRPQKRSCRQHPVCPTLRSGQPKRWLNKAGF